MSTSNPYEIARVKARDAAIAEAAQKAADPSAPEIISPLLCIARDGESPDNEIDLVQFEKLIRQIVDDLAPDIITAELIRRNFNMKAQIIAAVNAALDERFPPSDDPVEVKLE